MKNHYQDMFRPDMITEKQKKNPFGKLNDIVYDCLNDAINNVSLPPGEKLNITEIAKRLDVSITPVKNAVIRLMNEGMVEYRGVNAGYYVFDVTEKELTDIYDLRKCYEGFASFLCAQRLILVDLDKLYKLAEEYKHHWLKYAEGDETAENYKARRETDRDFHEQIIRYSDNALLYEEYVNSRKYFDYSLKRCLDYWKIDKGVYAKKMMAQQHVVVVNAIATGIPETAQKVAEEHVQFDKTQCFLRRNRQTVIGYRE